ncbi:MAG: hypothetical protein H6622_16405 [Halobacteriovoraceae bacterium]|nr:hypothetical protein [Halobacteriovoraceae bacterium]
MLKIQRLVILFTILGCGEVKEKSVSNNSNLETAKVNCVIPEDKGSMCTMQYTPVCGKIPCSNELKTFSNTCMMNNASAELVKEGPCE